MWETRRIYGACEHKSSCERRAVQARIKRIVLEFEWPSYDESDGESLRACEQVTEALYTYEINGTAVQPALAESCTPNEDLTVWTCVLRQGVTFHDGSSMDANDVVASWAAGIDASNANHIGNTGAFEYYSYLFDGLMNLPE